MIVSRIHARAALMSTLLLAPAAGASDAAALPHADQRARDGYHEYLQTEMHRAFAIAPGGAWAWRSGLDNADQAATAAVTACQANSEQVCIVYAINDEVVLNRKRWPTLWRPYSSAAQAAKARAGRHRGERLPDLLLTGPDAKPLALSSLRGKVAVVHFWGTWCPTCLHELPQLDRLIRKLKDVPDVAFVFTQMREPYAAAQDWLRRHDLNLPLYDSGSHRPQDNRLRLAGGGTLVDRALATVYPTTYVLDRHGIVVFSMRGSPDDWSQYEAFLRDLAEHSK